MGAHPLPRYALAFGLAALAGMVDALGLLKLGGLFVSFMSGNSTRMAVGIAGGTAVAGMAMGLIGAFVGGVFGGAVIGRLAGRWRKQAVLATVLGMLILAALSADHPGDAMTFLMAAAMGAVNNVFQRDGEVSIGVTYMTGALVKIGQHLAQAIAGRQAWDWVPYLVLWSGFLVGAGLGAWVFPLWGTRALLMASVAALVASG
ncbi:MAG: YoaK family protein, partial [Sphingobium sp.]|nr:YoaK family protein [Sphingobium sp.]